MASLTDSGLVVEDLEIAGHAQLITLRVYQPQSTGSVVPLIVYFHGGSFTRGSLDEADFAASFLARETPAWVVSVDYSLAPMHPFPAAPEDGYQALLWAIERVGKSRSISKKVGIAGHDAGGNLATCVAAMARDRGVSSIGGQVLLAPLIDPSLTRLAIAANQPATFDINECARCYRAYLPTAVQRMHPYAAPIESRRLGGLPPALIASAELDQLHGEADRYASELISAGVPTQVVRYRETSRSGLPENESVLGDVVEFFRARLLSSTRESGQR